MSEILHWSRFPDLGAAQVHDIFRLRQEIFIVEQACPYSDIDGRDLDAEHLMAAWSGDLVGCLRVISTGGEVRIGRIVVAAAARGTGLGHRMMEAAVSRCAGIHPGRPMVLSAQAHLTEFYARHGFIASSPAYLEDGIPHVDMRREA